jgi:hypothetical protein
VNPSDVLKLIADQKVRQAGSTHVIHLIQRSSTSTRTTGFSSAAMCSPMT